MTEKACCEGIPEIPEKVPGRAHYSLNYIRHGRIFSFAHQIDTVISLEPRSVLEIGVGSGIVHRCVTPRAWW